MPNAGAVRYQKLKREVLFNVVSSLIDRLLRKHAPLSAPRLTSMPQFFMRS